MYAPQVARGVSHRVGHSDVFSRRGWVRAGLGIAVALLGFGTAVLLAWRPVGAQAQAGPCINYLQNEIDAVQYKIDAWTKEKGWLEYFGRRNSNNLQRGYANAITERRAQFMFRLSGQDHTALTFAQNMTIDDTELPGGWPDLRDLGRGVYRLASPGGGEEPVTEIRGRAGGPIKHFDATKAENVLNIAIRIATNNLRQDEAELRAVEKKAGICCPTRTGGFARSRQPGARFGQPTAQTAACPSGGGGKTPTSTPPTSSTPTSTPTSPTTPESDCSGASPSSPPAPGCVRVTVRVIPAPLPSDPSNEGIGEGVGSATLEPAGTTIQCLNPADAPCVLTADVPANTPASVSAQPGSLSGDPSSPPDSAFYKFDGACTGTGTCTFRPTSGATVDVYFIPAMATLTLQASGDGGHANMTANESRGGGLEPTGPVDCGFSYPADPLPCSVMVRVEKFAQVEANTAGDPNITLVGFSTNCTPESTGASFCELRMTTNQTVTADFGGSALG